MKRALPLILVLFVAAAAHADIGLTSSEPQASLVLWRPTVDGTLGAQAGSVAAGASYHEGPASSFGATAAFRTFGAVCLDVDFTPIETDAPVAAKAAFTFKNTTFSATTSGHLNYEMPIFGAGLRYLVLTGKRGNLGVIGAIKVVSPDVKLTVGSTSAGFHLTLPVPLAGISGQVKIVDHVALFGSYKFLHLDLSAVNVHVVNWESGLAYDHPVNKTLTARAAAGYRRLDVDLAEGAAGDLRLSTKRGGPFVEAAVQF
jgi:hypothetical protein